MCPPGLHKTSMRVPEANMQQSKIQSSESWSVLIHPPPNTEPPYTKHIISSPIPFQNWSIFAVLEALGKELQMFFQLQKQRTIVWGSDLLSVHKSESKGTLCEDPTSFEFLSVCLLTALSTLRDWQLQLNLSLRDGCEQKLGSSMHLFRHVGLVSGKTGP